MNINEYSNSGIGKERMIRYHTNEFHKYAVLRESAANDNLFKLFSYISFSLQKYISKHLIP